MFASVQTAGRCGKSSDIRETDFSSPSFAARGCRGEPSMDGVPLNWGLRLGVERFSKWESKEDTGFCIRCVSHCSFPMYIWIHAAGFHVQWTTHHGLASLLHPLCPMSPSPYSHVAVCLVGQTTNNARGCGNLATAVVSIEKGIWVNVCCTAPMPHALTTGLEEFASI